MTTPVSIAVMALAGFQQQNAQVAYDEYVAAFEKSLGITGSTTSTMFGGTTTKIFRLLPGGKSIVYETNRLEYCDGKQVFNYSYDENKYAMSSPWEGIYGLAFGPRFAPPDSPRPKVISYRDEMRGDRPVRLFMLEFSDNAGPAELEVRMDKRLPTAITFFGQQGSWGTVIHEVHPNRVIRPETVTWSPPPGAQKVDQIRG